MKQYETLLEDQIFMNGSTGGRIRTAMSVLTDMLIDLNALEIYYRKPNSKSSSPKEVIELREKIEYLKSILQNRELHKS